MEVSEDGEGHARCKVDGKRAQCGNNGQAEEVHLLSRFQAYSLPGTLWRQVGRHVDLDQCSRDQPLAGIRKRLAWGP
jgi:hypothetical protein